MRLVLKCQAVSLLSCPLASYEDGIRFKLYANGAGLLMAMRDYDMKVAVASNTLAGYEGCSIMLASLGKHLLHGSNSAVACRDA